MRINKAIREYMEKTLTAKRLEANRKAREYYELRRKECIEELNELLEYTMLEAEKILKKHNMSTNINRYGSTQKAVESIFNFKDIYVENQEESRFFTEEEKKRYEKQKEFIEQIELDAAFGASKDEFLKKLEAITF